MVLLRRIVPNLANRADLWTGLIVLRFRAAYIDRQVQPQVLGSNRSRLSAPDRERGVASARSGARQSGAWEHPDQESRQENRPPAPFPLAHPFDVKRDVVKETRRERLGNTQQAGAQRSTMMQASLRTTYATQCLDCGKRRG